MMKMMTKEFRWPGSGSEPEPLSDASSGEEEEESAEREEDVLKSTNEEEQEVFDG